jgi:hypothetical protein
MASARNPLWTVIGNHTVGNGGVITAGWPARTGGGRAALDESFAGVATSSGSRTGTTCPGSQRSGGPKAGGAAWVGAIMELTSWLQRIRVTSGLDHIKHHTTILAVMKVASL